MKAIVTSDTHENAESIKEIVDFAKSNGIETVFDAGDLHGEIRCFDGIKLHAVYWDRACGAMEDWRFRSEVSSIGGTVHRNGTGFKLEDLVIFMQHNLADYEADIPSERLDIANQCIDRIAEENPDEALKRFIFFGHTHKIYYFNDGKTIAINPGYSGEDKTFAVLDSDNNSVEFRTKDRVLFRVDEDSDFTQVRGFDIDTGDRILRLRNCKEVFEYHDNGIRRTEEFAKIHQAFNSREGLRLKVEHEDCNQQLILSDFRSKRLKKIGEYGICYDEKSSNYGKLEFYVGTKDIDGSEKEVLVVLEDEIESIPFDRIKIKKIPIISQNIIFVGQTVVGEKHEDPEDNEYREHLVINNQVKVSYDSIDDIIEKEGRVVITSRDKKRKSLVTIISSDGSVIEGREYDSVTDANYHDRKIVDSKIVYIAKENDEMFVVIDGIEQTKHKFNPESWRDKLRDVTFINGTLAYIIEKENSQSIFYNGIEREKVEPKGYSYGQGISNLSEFDGKLAYLIRIDGQKSKIIVDDRTVVEAEDITAFSGIGGHLVYQIGGGFGSDPECFIQNGKKIEGYSRLGEISKAYSEGRLNLNEGGSD